MDSILLCFVLVVILGYRLGFLRERYKWTRLIKTGDLPYPSQWKFITRQFGGNPMPSKWDFLKSSDITHRIYSKCLTRGEFKVAVDLPCPKCYELDDFDPGCSLCQGEGEYIHYEIVPWSTCKDIYKRMHSAKISDMEKMNNA